VSTLLIAPHADDETLFASFLAQRTAARVVVVFDEGREGELAQATAWLGCTYEQWRYDPARPDWQEIAARIAEEGAKHETTWAPAVIGGGNGYEDPSKPPPPHWGVLQHDHIGQLAADALGDRCHAYCLYTRWNGRHQATESFPDEPEHVARKLAALSCYRSQIADPATGPWFYSLLDMREWTT
jgi:LmbE family N-acetylglucosaminyl deacetylase